MSFWSTLGALVVYDTAKTILKDESPYTSRKSTPAEDEYYEEVVVNNMILYLVFLILAIPFAIYYSSGVVLGMGFMIGVIPSLIFASLIAKGTCSLKGIIFCLSTITIIGFTMMIILN